MGKPNMPTTLRYCHSYLYTTEIFPTHVRTTAVASGSAVSRVAGIIIPTLSQYLNGIDKRLPWILFSFAAVVSTVAAVLSTKVTVGKSLPSRFRCPQRGS